MKKFPLTCLVLFGLSLHAQEKKDYSVKNGKVAFEAKGKHYEIPVFKNARNVQVDTTNGIEVTYGLDIKSRKDAHAIEQQFTKFYKGKKIFGSKVPKFEEIDQGGSPGAEWVSMVCNEPGKSVRIHYFAQYQMMGIMITISDSCPKKTE